MKTSVFAEFEAYAKALGCEEVLVREWASNQQVQTHTHPFDAYVQVVKGELWLTVGETVRHLVAGDGFELARETSHSERYGLQGATVWVGRRSAIAA